MNIKKIFIGMKEAIKVIFVAVLISFIGYTYINWFLIPDEKLAIEQLSKIENSISAHYDEVNHVYNDVEVVNKLQKIAIELQFDLQKTANIKVALTSLILLTIVGVLGWWLQYVFTTVEFTNKDDKNSSVLAMALLCATIIVGVVYYVSKTG